MPFIPGLTICRDFFEEVVKPSLMRRYPTILYSAGLFGSGSEVLGFDTEQSTDHDWRPRIFIFLSDEDEKQLGHEIEERLKSDMPSTFRGYSTKVGGNDRDPRNRIVFSTRSYFQQYLGIDPFCKLLSTEWLLLSEQRLLSVAKGAVFYDGLGELEIIRQAFGYFPDDVWLYLMGCQWMKISQEEAFVGRAGDVGDELGSAVIAVRLVNQLMRLCFLIERQYAPYSKWFGSAFSSLACAPRLMPLLTSAIRAVTWKQREAELAKVYEFVAAMHNKLNISDPLPTRVTQFHERPYLVIHGDSFASAILSKIQDPQLQKVPPIGSIDQVVDCTEILNDSVFSKRLQVLYAAAQQEMNK